MFYVLVLERLPYRSASSEEKVLERTSTSVNNVLFSNVEVGEIHIFSLLAVHFASSKRSKT